MSQNKTVSWRRSASIAAGRIEDPHAEQYRAPSEAWAPHCLQDAPSSMLFAH
jgi:hypothetical protein